MSDFVRWPADRPPRFLTGTACDMLVGSCACGATHDGTEGSAVTITPARLAEIEALWNRAGVAADVFRVGEGMSLADLFAALRAAWEERDQLLAELAQFKDSKESEETGETCMCCCEPATKFDAQGIPLCSDCSSECFEQ